MSQLIIDNTTLASIRRCKRFAYYRHKRDLVLPDTESPLMFGAAIHAGLAEILRGQTVGEACSEALKLYKAPADTTDWRTPERLVSVIEDFVEHLKTNPITVAKTSTGEAVVEAEFAFEQEFPSLKDLLRKAGYDGVMLSGIIDAIVVDPATGGFYVLDHKTDSWSARKGGDQPYIAPEAFDKWKPAGALPLYLIAAQRLLPEGLVQGVIVNIIGLGRPTVKNPDGFNVFGRAAINWTPDELQESLDDIEGTLEEWLTDEVNNLYPRNPESCYRFGRPCPYILLCRAPASVREQLETTYTKSKWNPLERRGSTHE